MERDVRHPHLFTLCGFVLCIMFASNLALAATVSPPKKPTVMIYLRVSDLVGTGMDGFIATYAREHSQQYSTLTRVIPDGDMNMERIRAYVGEWVTVNLTQISALYRCKNYQDAYRFQVGKGALMQDAVITPRLTVERESTVCRLDISAAANY